MLLLLVAKATHHVAIVRLTNNWTEWGTNHSIGRGHHLLASTTSCLLYKEIGWWLSRVDLLLTEHKLGLLLKQELLLLLLLTLDASTFHHIVRGCHLLLLLVLLLLLMRAWRWIVALHLRCTACYISPSKSIIARAWHHWLHANLGLDVALRLSQLLMMALMRLLVWHVFVGVSLLLDLLLATCKHGRPLDYHVLVHLSCRLCSCRLLS